MCSLCRYLMADSLNAAMTASSQWMERTLDDSANRRISLPEGFLCADSVLRLARNITFGLVVNEAVIARSVSDYLPFITTENILMEAVKRGGDRQVLHEIIRKCSMSSTEKMKRGESWDLISELASHKEFGFGEDEMRSLMDPRKCTGRCASQVEMYIEKIRPLIGDTVPEGCDIEV